MILELYKPIGQTSVEFINELKTNNPQYKKLCFAGRLDPLACGKLCILTDEDIFKKEEFCKKNKIYETYIIKGITTDTYDIMGFPQTSNKKEEIILNKFDQKYPPYSSIIIPKYHKPYWLVTKLNLPLNDEDIPTKNVEIQKIEQLDNFTMDSKELLNLIENRINKVNINQQFRQKEIILKWKELLKHEKIYNIIKLQITCSSGTYIRNIGNMLNGCCYDICRIQYN